MALKPIIKELKKHRKKRILNNFILLKLNNKYQFQTKINRINETQSY